MRISDWSSDVCSSDLALAEHHLLNGAFAEAEPLAREAAAAIAESLGEEAIVTARAYKIVAFTLQGQGELAEAVGFAQTAYATEQRVLPPYHSAIGETLALLVELYEALGQHENLAAAQTLLDAHRAERKQFEQAN